MSLLRLSTPGQFQPRPAWCVRTKYRGLAGAIDSHDLVPFDAACTRPEAYDSALVRVDAHLTAAVQELTALTPPEAELSQLGHVLLRARNQLRARRTRAGQLMFPLLTHTQTPRSE